MVSFNFLNHRTTSSFFAPLLCSAHNFEFPLQMSKEAERKEAIHYEVPAHFQGTLQTIPKWSRSPMETPW